MFFSLYFPVTAPVDITIGALFLIMATFIHLSYYYYYKSILYYMGLFWDRSVSDVFEV